ncbi:orotidine-5'-phosphate decarboxylase [Persephonella hydrogeniphila]|uniref:Orotidine 5'-phosphate decarboxylase n=1 Tax=Persephonella hydrogeniphila TaxID=198703 RepID=A0A285NEL6_9AQUI|nr:orotidine-5'-phosphate decarboxylase [Persephonella hydrogeniphila]SNZ07954.1 orotidine-5'-phosphate decarboxylase [Persephonella hydrogeniphila]
MTVKLAVALDIENTEEALSLLKDLKGEEIIIKIGYLLFIKEGTDIVKKIKDMGFDIFLDLKLHDIPNTVYNGVRSAVELGVDYLTVHTLGGIEMMEKAVEAKKGSNLKLLGVTILTSHSEDYIQYIGSRYSLNQLALKLATTAVNTGIDGIVCSPFEVKEIKEKIDKDFIAVTPGIRLEQETDDQKRVATPEFAVKEGSDILVVGRPIIKAKDKKKAVREILEKIKNA